ncbi:MAG: hypothetical protein PF450_08425, partial [Bacteroidales bacterium]|nr:hypothetical protein [Bacteroidales bacterium]
MLRNRIYYIISIPVFILLYFYTAIVVFNIIIFSYLNWEKGVNGIIRFWAKSVFPIMGKKLHRKGKENFQK